MALDFGLKRTGIAVTDNLKIIATALDTVPTAEIIPFLGRYFENEAVETVVIGKSVRLNNTEQDIEKYIQMFIVDLKKNFPALKIERFDERFTSRMAHYVLLDSGIKKMKRRNKAIIDKISATLILQSYLENKI